MLKKMCHFALVLAIFPYLNAEKIPYLLHHHALEGNYEEVCALLKQGADPSQKDASGRTPLYYALAQSRDPVIHELIRAGADLEDLGGFEEDSSFLQRAMCFNQSLDYVQWALFESPFSFDPLFHMLISLEIAHTPTIAIAQKASLQQRAHAIRSATEMRTFVQDACFDSSFKNKVLTLCLSNHFRAVKKLIYIKSAYRDMTVLKLAKNACREGERILELLKPFAQKESVEKLPQDIYSALEAIWKLRLGIE